MKEYYNEHLMHLIEYMNQECIPVATEVMEKALGFLKDKNPHAFEQHFLNETTKIIHEHERVKDISCIDTLRTILWHSMIAKGHEKEDKKGFCNSVLKKLDGRKQEKTIKEVA